MSRFLEYAAVLEPHAETSGQTVQAIRARVRCTNAGGLVLRYTVRGDIARLRIAPLRPPRRADNLWRHTCFEVFVSPAGGAEYWEFNFSPSGEWAVYGFRAYRVGLPSNDAEPAPEIATDHADERFQLDATIDLERLPIAAQRTQLRLGLCAVLEHENGALSYWALKHPAGKPDFHHADSFSLEIARPEPEMAKP